MEWKWVFDLVVMLAQNIAANIWKDIEGWARDIEKVDELMEEKRNGESNIIPAKYYYDKDTFDGAAKIQDIQMAAYDKYKISITEDDVYALAINRGWGKFDYVEKKVENNIGPKWMWNWFIEIVVRELFNKDRV